MKQDMKPTCDIYRESDFCNHDKVYSNSILTTNPPQHKWICRKCKVQGTDYDRYEDIMEYDKLVSEQETMRKAMIEFREKVEKGGYKYE